MYTCVRMYTEPEPILSENHLNIALLGIENTTAHLRRSTKQQCAHTDLGDMYSAHSTGEGPHPGFL